MKDYDMLDTAIWALEQEYWTSDADYYRQRLADDCLLVLPSVGVQRKEQAVASIAAAPRWAHCELLERQAVWPRPDVGVLSYRVVARRNDDAASYEASVVSVHVLQEGDWLLSFHQQCPIEVRGGPR